MMLRRNSLSGSTVLLLLLVPSFASADAKQLEEEKKADEKANAFLQRRQREFAESADELTTLRVERYKVACFYVRLLCLGFGEPVPLYCDRLCEAVKLRVDSELALTVKQEERLDILAGHVEFLRKNERVKKERHKAAAGHSTLADVTQAVLMRRDGEVRLLEAKREKDAGKAK